MADGGQSKVVADFTPGPETSRAFRDALGRFATGVTVVTTMTDHGPIGMTVNSFASVSLDPPLVLWSPARRAFRFTYFTTATHYAIHVLRAEQQPLAMEFARREDALDLVDWRRNEHGVPLITDHVARFECKLEAVHEGGDHAIVVGRVLKASIAEGQPLVFLGGHFGRFKRIV